MFKAVEDSRSQNHEDPQRLRRVIADGRGAHKDNADKAHHNPQQLNAPGSLTKEPSRNQGGEDRRRPVQQACNRAVHMLLRQREDRERNSYPDEPQERDHPAILRVRETESPLTKRAGDQQGQRAKPDAQQRNESRLERVKTDVDEEERGAPNGRHPAEQHPVGGGELAGVHDGPWPE